MCYTDGMAGKQKLTHTDDLNMARDVIVNKLSMRQVCDKYQIATPNTIYNHLRKIKEEHPEYIEHLEIIKLGSTGNLAQIESQITELEALKEHPATNKHLADKIEDILHHLLNMTPADIQRLKPEHRLRNVDPLVKAMRLLREESTGNVKKLSIVKAVGIATARRKPTTE